MIIRICFVGPLTFLLVLGCASAGGAKKGEDPAPVYMTAETAPTCSYKEVGLIEFTNTESSEGDELALSIKHELGRRARHRGADAVVNAGWRTMLTVVSRSNRAPSSSASQVGGPKHEVKGTAIKFDSPDCRH
jgi:hypothetical protein